jgi:high affinity Mn2+ porin
VHFEQPQPGPEQILETCCSLLVGAWRFSADYQLVVNPGGDRDRGPRSILSARLRAQF